MRRTLILIALLLLAMGLTLLIFGMKMEENQNKTGAIVLNTLDDTTFNVDEHGYQVKKIVLNANITILASISVTGTDGDERCIDLYVLNNMSYASWLQKEAEHQKDKSWFMKEEDSKYISVEVHGTDNAYMFNTDHAGTYYFVLDNSGRCSKTVSFKLFEIKTGTENLTGGNSQLRERLSLVSGSGLLAFGLILLVYGFSSEPPPIEAIKGTASLKRLTTQRLKRQGEDSHSTNGTLNSWIICLEAGPSLRNFNEVP